MLLSSQRSAVGVRRGAERRRLCVVATAAPSVDTKPHPGACGPPQFHNPKMGVLTTDQQFKAVLKGMVQAGQMPANLEPAWVYFYDNYKTAVTTSGAPGSDEKLVTQVQASILDNVIVQMTKPYEFPSHHKRITEPYDYYEFGQRYVGSLIDFDNSVLCHRDRWDHIQSLLDQKHNVVLLANHQTEADPGVFAHMLKATHPKLATDVIYVAGDRVVTDPLCKPFSMGRNLFCVHSKKHLDDVPELKAAKMETNRKTLIAMQRALNAGGVLMWIAPSGGRDRPKGDKWLPDPMDAAAVELMWNLTHRAKQPGHLFPMAMYSWPLMPPPKTVDKSIGEQRNTGFTGVGISVAEELDVVKLTEGLDKEHHKDALAKAAHTAVVAQFEAMEKAIHDPAFRAAQPEFSQPWR